MKYKYGVFLGRMQPIHLGHINIIVKMLNECENCLILIGSENTVRTEKNPFIIFERKLLINDALSYIIKNKLVDEKSMLERIASNKIKLLSIKDMYDPNINGYTWGMYLYKYISRVFSSKFTYYCSSEYNPHTFFNRYLTTYKYVEIEVVKRENHGKVELSATYIRSKIFKNLDDVSHLLPIDNRDLWETIINYTK